MFLSDKSQWFNFVKGTKYIAPKKDENFISSNEIMQYRIRKLNCHDIFFTKRFKLKSKYMR